MPAHWLTAQASDTFSPKSTKIHRYALVSSQPSAPRCAVAASVCPDGARLPGALLTVERNIWRQLQLGLMRTPSVEYAAPAGLWTAPSRNTPAIAKTIATAQAARNARISI